MVKAAIFIAIESIFVNHAIQANRLNQTFMNKRLPREIYTRSQAAQICHLSPSTLFRAIRNKQIKAFSTPGGHFRITQQDLDEFLIHNGMPPVMAAPRRRKVLVVEDNPIELRLM